MRVSDVLEPRSIEDVFAEIVRIELGGELYTLPVLTIRENREWKRSLEVVIVELLADATAAGDDRGAVLTALAADPGPLLDVLVSYDRTGVLPPRDVIEDKATDVGVIRAVMEVWRAANPLVDTGLAWIETIDPPTSEPPQPMSSQLPSTDGALGGSRRN